MKSGTVLLRLAAAAAVLTLGTAPAYAAQKTERKAKKSSKVTHAERKAAAQRAEAMGLVLPEFGTAQMAEPGTAPHYYGPYANYANSPLRLPAAVVEISGGGGTGAAASADVDLTTGTITDIQLTSGGSGYAEAPLVTISSPVAGASGAFATAAVTDGVVTGITLVSGGSGYVTPGMRKFVDALPSIPAAVPDTTTFPGSDYYEIALVQFRQKLHADLPPTLLRGYVQLASAGVALETANLDGTTTPILLNGQPVYGVTSPQYLGPAIVATKDRPVRILFRNLLPTGLGGNLFIPVDTTVMGSGPGAAIADPGNPQEPLCGTIDPNTGMKPSGCYTENRATLHLHGGISPWISDGTPHQWITPANESTPYPKGVSVKNVPDMPEPGPGAMTFFYTNQQSARLLFYHDHAWGITRLNVYAGEAAPYIITDPMEQNLVAKGLIPGPADTIPLVVQDKTFVPSLEQLSVQDPTWDVARWGGEGNLWVPHVYVPAQNPGDTSGVNQFGRWAYGPWFWPPTIVENGPVANPHYDPNCNPLDLPDVWCEPPLIPGTPYVSMGMESFNDTPMVNGVAYPTVTLEPKTYRFRVLNAANDRFFNLQLYVAGDAAGTEVALNAAEVAAALEDPAGIFPTPDEALSPKGPDWIQIGTEGGFLPAPVVVPSDQFTTWVTDPTVFNAGNVDKHSLLLGPAERADVIVDFSQFAGKTLILYNDAPAAFPARDPRYDYYTGNPDLTDTGGAPPTIAGFGPNTRTVMQIKIAAAEPAAPFNLTALQNAWKATALGGEGVFELSQNPIIVGQGAYNSAYNSQFRNFAPRDGLARITDFELSYNTLGKYLASELTTTPLQPKAIQDEQGEAFDKMYGRMSGNLGLEAPNAKAGAQNLMLYAFAHPPTEVLRDDATAGQAVQLWKITHNGVDTHPVHFHLYDVQLVNRVGWDGIVRKPELTELGWKDTVRVSPLEDTIVALRPIIPRVQFPLPNSIRLLDPSKPVGAPLSEGGFPVFDPNGEPVVVTNHYVNFGHEYVWHCHILSHEEMDMMRPQAVASSPAAPTDVSVTTLPGPRRVQLTFVDNSANETGFVIERMSAGTWASVGSLASDGVTSPGIGPRTFVDQTVVQNVTYQYRVFAVNVVGDTWNYSDPAINQGASFPTETVASATTETVFAGPPTPPSNVTATQPGTGTRDPVIVTWIDNAPDLANPPNYNGEDGFTVRRGTSATGPWTTLTSAVPASPGIGGTVSYTDTSAARRRTYYYQVIATNKLGSSTAAVSNALTTR